MRYIMTTLSWGWHNLIADYKHTIYFHQNTWQVFDNKNCWIVSCSRSSDALAPISLGLIARTQNPWYLVWTLIPKQSLQLKSNCATQTLHWIQSDNRRNQKFEQTKKYCSFISSCWQDIVDCSTIKMRNTARSYTTQPISRGVTIHFNSISSQSNPPYIYNVKDLSSNSYTGMNKYVCYNDGKSS